MRVVGCFDRGASAARVHATCFSRARAAEVKAPGARRGIAMAVRVRGDGRAGGRRAVCGERASTTGASNAGAGSRRRIEDGWGRTSHPGASHD
jgi:hypothetical protein